MRKASLHDVPLLVTMMAEFYSASPYALNPRRATGAFTSLLEDERLGTIWLIQSGSMDVGYVVLVYCHSMTYGGQVAIVDDFFIRQRFRGAGLGKAAMIKLRELCAANGIRAMQVETGTDNPTALAVYKQAGFVQNDHVHLTLALAAQTHAPD